MRTTMRLDDQPNAVQVAPGPWHWGLFVDLRHAVETGSEPVTIDRSPARFPGLRRRHPLG